MLTANRTMSVYLSLQQHGSGRSDGEADLGMREQPRDNGRVCAGYIVAGVP